MAAWRRIASVQKRIAAGSPRASAPSAARSRAAATPPPGSAGPRRSRAGGCRRRLQRRISQSQPKLDASRSATTLTGSSFRSWAMRRTRCRRFASQRRTASMASPSIAVSAPGRARCIRTSAAAICSTSDSSATFSGLICATQRRCRVEGRRLLLGDDDHGGHAVLPAVASALLLALGGLRARRPRGVPAVGLDLTVGGSGHRCGSGCGISKVRWTIGRRHALSRRTRAVTDRIVPHAVASHKTFAEPAVGPTHL